MRANTVGEAGVRDSEQWYTLVWTSKLHENAVSGWSFLMNGGGVGSLRASGKDQKKGAKAGVENKQKS